jgi:dihydropteroate synthase
MGVWGLQAPVGVQGAKPPGLFFAVTWAGLPPGSAVMGIVNVTPDSFSDGGRHFDAGVAVAAGLAMVEAGAALLDIGGESTRPGAAAIDIAEERRRVVPVIRGLREAGVPLSVDTRNAAVMAAALEAGASIVNDISALAHDPDAVRVVAAAGCPVILMHMRGTPATMMQFRRYDDVAADVTRELAARMAAAEAAGVARERIALDPGIGFAKGEAENLAMLAGLPVLCALGRPVVVGVSRKAFIGRIAGVQTPAERGAGSLAAGLFAVGLGAAILRVHDVAETVQALRVWQALAASATSLAPRQTGGQTGIDR